MRLRYDDGRWREHLGMGQRIEGTQRVGQVCFGSMRAARQDWQKRYFCAQEAFDEGK